MRVNFLLLAGLILLVAGQSAMRGNYAMAAAGVAVAALMIIVHFIRVRRFKRFDERQAQKKTFE